MRGTSWESPLGKGTNTAPVRRATGPCDSRLGRVDKILEFFAQFMTLFGNAQYLVIICRAEFQVTASMVLSKFKFHDLPCIVQFISLVQHVKKIKMFLKPGGVFAFTTQLVSGDLEAPHVCGCFRPLATSEG